MCSEDHVELSSRKCPDKDTRGTPSTILSVNKRWACVASIKDPQYFPRVEEGQSPRILWIGCSDSRVLEADITVTRPGDVFVHRNIASQFQPTDDNALAVLEYSVKYLRIRDVVIVGHKNCGGVIAAFEAAFPSCRGEIDEKVSDGVHIEPVDGSERSGSSYQSALSRWLVPLATRLGSLMPPVTLEHAHEENVRIQVENLLTLRQDILGWSEGHAVRIHGWLYDFSTGIVRHMVTEHMGPE
ncbi:carbonic anhydrase [Scleroderma yunnanense]